MGIIRGTTPTIKYTFQTIQPEDIEVAYLTIEQCGTSRIEKSLSEAIVGTDNISWMLSQEDTLSLVVGKVDCMCNWRKADGTRGASRVARITIEDNLKSGVI